MEGRGGLVEQEEAGDEERAEGDDSANSIGMCGGAGDIDLTAVDSLDEVPLGGKRPGMVLDDIRSDGKSSKMVQRGSLGGGAAAVPTA